MSPNNGSKTRNMKPRHRADTPRELSPQLQKSPGAKSKSMIYVALAISLAVVPLIAYIPSFSGSFHLDDWPIALNNHFIRIHDLSLQSLFGAAFQDFGNNRPLGNLSLAFNYYFSGDKPLTYHIFNFLVLILTAFGIWLVLSKLLNRLGFDHLRAVLASWAAALIWVCHPVNVQAITYVIQRYASMAGMFSIWSVYFFHVGWERTRRKALLFTLGCLFCLFAILSKENAITLPAIIFLYKVFFFDDLQPGWLAKNRIWILGLTLFYGLTAAAIFRPSMSAIVFNFSRQPFTAWQRSLTEPRVLLWYPLLIAFPFPQFLSILHTFHASQSLFQPGTILSFLAIMFLVLLAFFSARKRRVLSFAIFWYFGQLLVEAMPLPIELAHEHRLYLASLSLIGPAVGWPVLKARTLKTVVAWILVIAAFFSFFTFRRNMIYRTELIFWREVTSKAPDFSSLPWRIYCETLADKNDCEHAIPICRQALKISPDDSATINNLGVCYQRTGKIDEAEAEYLHATSLNPEDAVVAYNLGLCYLRKGKFADAEAAFKRAASKNPGNPHIAFNLGLALMREQNYEEAADWFRQDLLADPQNAKAHANLAFCLSHLHQEYLEELEKALAIDPHYAEVRAEIAAIYAQRGNCRQALQLINEAPESTEYLRQIAQGCENKARNNPALLKGPFETP
jgi:tetratricopeptide (TPR) repeat protein